MLLIYHALGCVGTQCVPSVATCVVAKFYRPIFYHASLTESSSSSNSPSAFVPRTTPTRTCPLGVGVGERGGRPPLDPIPSGYVGGHLSIASIYRIYLSHLSINLPTYYILIHLSICHPSIASLPRAPSRQA